MIDLTALGLILRHLFLQINIVIQDTTKPLQLTIEHNPQPPDDLPDPNHPLDVSGSTDPEKLGSTHKLPSVEEEPNPEQESGPTRIGPLSTQCRGSAGLRSRHIMSVQTLLSVKNLPVTFC